jgi:hypothetical protein
MLLFIYFNPVIGPDILLSIPSNIPELISEEDLDQIKRLMDSATPGFFTHAFSPQINTANYFFMLPSLWARGHQEMIMVSKIIEEDNPNLGDYEREFREFARLLKENRPMVFKAFYIHNPPLNYEEEIKSEFGFLRSEIEKLAKIFSLSEIQTYGNLIPYDQIKKYESLFVPPKILRDLETYLESMHNYFVVFQKRKDSFKADIIPFAHDRIVKITVLFFGQLGPETLRAIGLVFQEMRLPLVYTSGICQQGGKCIYEVYLDPQQVTDFEPTRQRLKSVSKVDEVKIVTIDLTKRD